MNDIEALRALVTDAFGRVEELVIANTTGLTPEVGRYRPDPQANSICWLIWHASRVQDDHVSDLAGVQQAWPRWRERFGLPFDDWATGFGQTPEEVGQVDVAGELLAGYHRDVQAITRDYLDELTGSELERVVDTDWDPPVTATVRLVSVIGDLTQHLGQASYVRGLAERAGIG